MSLGGIFPTISLLILMRSTLRQGYNILVVRSIVNVHPRYPPVAMSIHSKEGSVPDTNQEVVVQLQ